MINIVVIFLTMIISIYSPFIATAAAGESQIDLTEDPSRQPGRAKSSSVVQKTQGLSSKSGGGSFDSEKILEPFHLDESFHKEKGPADRNSLPPTVSLQALEKDFRAAPDVLVAVAELEESLSLLEQKQARSGLKVFGGAGIGTYREPVTDILVRDFRRANVRFGLRYPLLGSLEQERIDILKAEARTKEKEHEIEFVRRKSLGALHTFYISYWGSQRKIDLSQAFLENEPEVEKILDYRTRAGYLLDADRQEFLSAFALVRRNIANLKTSHNRAFNVLRLMTKPGLVAFSPITPKLTKPCLDLDKLKTIVMDTHPEINLLRKQVESQLDLQNATRYSDIEADVTLAGTAISDLPQEQTGYGVAVNLNVQLPAKIKKVKAARVKGRQATLKKIQRQLDLRSITLLQEAEEALDRFRAASENVAFATQRLKAGMESVRENLLRSAYLEGDTIEKLQQSRYRYYQSAINYIDAEINKIQAQARLLQFSPNGCQPKMAATAIERASHQPINSKNRLNPGRKPKTNRLPAVLAHSRTFPIRGELPDVKQNQTIPPAHHDLELRDIVIAQKRSLPPVPKQEILQQQSDASNNTKPCTSNCYTVQVGSYKHLAGAKSFKRGFEHINHNMVIRAVDLPGKGRMYRVHMGAFADNLDAKKLARHLAQEYGQPSFIVHLKKK